MALIDTHPDYMALDGSNPQAGEYPIGLYKELLHYARSRYAGEHWAALPRQVAAYLLKSMALAPAKALAERTVAHRSASHLPITLYGMRCVCCARAAWLAARRDARE